MCSVVAPAKAENIGDDSEADAMLVVADADSTAWTVSAADNQLSAADDGTVGSDVLVASEGEPTLVPLDDGGEVSVYRLYNWRSSEHLYTTSKAEYDSLPGRTGGDWRREGVAWVAPSSSSSPVWRLYNPGLGDHHYTSSRGECDQLVSRHGWRNEGVAFYSDDSRRTPLYRLYNGGLTAGQHHYTSSAGERDSLARSHGWKNEGAAFYAVRAAAADGANLSEVKRLAKNPIVLVRSGDFDSDGLLETFVVTAQVIYNNYACGGVELWFVNSGGVTTRAAAFNINLLCWDDTPGLYSDDFRYQFFCADQTVGGPTSTSRAFGVRDGKAVEASFGVSYIGRVHYDTALGKTVGTTSTIDTGGRGRMWQKYGFTFDQSSYSFRTTGAIGGLSYQSW